MRQSWLPKRHGTTAILAMQVACAAALGAQRAPVADTSGLGAALRHYAALVRRTASDSLAAIYLPTGELAAPGRSPIVGPTAIAAFLHQYDAYRVLRYEARQDSVRVRADTTWQFGRWWQRVRLPSGDTAEVNGGLAAEWVRHGGTTSWRLRRLATFRLDAGPWPADTASPAPARRQAAVSGRGAPREAPGG